MTRRSPLAPERWRRISELFDEVADLPARARERELETIAATDSDLAAELRRLLAADSGEHSLLDQPLGLAASTEPAAPPESAPERAGPFRVVGLLGRGGMADVYAGERDDGAFEQSVAIKIVRRGLDTEDLLARFRRERSILARLEHPAIARVIDGGALADGRPYLVMERVDGVPIHLFAQERALAIEDRLRLLLVACDAVAFAHRSLVVHRDLKPSNVLVSAGGELKLLDFGIATILAPDGSPRQTMREARALTPAYAAPEQIAGEPTTTATDIWGIGALAFELLAHEPPLPQRRGLGSGDSAVTADQPPPRLSTRALATIGGDVEGRRWAARLRGDLDVIVGKALALDPARRYPSVEAFADDLRRHLDGRPVQAQPDSLGYRAGKFVLRHRVGVAAAGAGALSLVGGAALALWQARVARRQRDTAERARERSENLVEFLLSDLQKKLEPSNRLDVVADLAREVLRSLDSIPERERTATDTAQRARVLIQLASVLQYQGDPKHGEMHLREAIDLLARVAAERAPLPDVAVRFAEARTVLVRTLSDAGNWSAADDAGRLAVAAWRSLVADHAGDADSLFGLALALDERGRIQIHSGDALGAKASHLEAVAVIESMPDHARAERDVIMELYNAHLYAGRGYELAGETLAAAEQYRVAMEQAIAFSDANPMDIRARHQVSVVTNDWGRVLRRMGRLDEAGAAFVRAQAITEEVVERDPGNLFFLADLAACHAFLGRVHEMQGDPAAALAEFGADVALNQRLVSTEPDNGSWRGFLSDALTNEGRVLMELGRIDDALARHQSALELRRRALDSNLENAGAQADVGESLLERGRVLERLGRAGAASGDWQQAVELLAEALRSTETSNTRVRFARTLLELGEVARARPVVERLLREGSNEPELLAACKRRGLLARSRPPSD